MSALILLITFSPFVALFVLVMLEHGFDFPSILHVPSVREINWAVFIPTAIWFRLPIDLIFFLTDRANGAYDSIGSLAGEVKNGRPTFLKGYPFSPSDCLIRYRLAGSLPLALMTYILPIAICYLPQHNWRFWGEGYFLRVGTLLNP